VSGVETAKCRRGRPGRGRARRARAAVPGAARCRCRSCRRCEARCSAAAPVRSQVPSCRRCEAGCGPAAGAKPGAAPRCRGKPAAAGGKAAHGKKYRFPSAPRLPGRRGPTLFLETCPFFIVAGLAIRGREYVKTRQSGFVVVTPWPHATDSPRTQSRFEAKVDAGTGLTAGPACLRSRRRS